jgi:hypothetical protein
MLMKVVERRRSVVWTVEVEGIVTWSSTRDRLLVWEL